MAIEGSRRERDEIYILNLCDEIIGHRGIRQHKFPFLTGDAGRNGYRRPLSVDIYYPHFNVVIEYRESQHSRPNKMMDRRMTVSGALRGERRRLYDERRRTVLKDNNVRLVELEYSEFRHKARGRLMRDRAADGSVIRDKLRSVLKGLTPLSYAKRND